MLALVVFMLYGAVLQNMVFQFKRCPKCKCSDEKQTQTEKNIERHWCMTMGYVLNYNTHGSAQK